MAKATEKKTSKKRAASKSRRKPRKRDLVIVESPAKAKTINRFLGRRYNVVASMGHVRDLPKKSFGIDVENDFTPKYVRLTAKKDVISALTKAVKNAEDIYLAVDRDREGEAIAWHVAELLKIPEERLHRITFNEITKRAIKAAMEEPGKIDMRKVNAQQTRRILDRIVGYKLSPLLWKKITKGLSAGRVQSVSLKLIVHREKAIGEFRAEKYWTLAAVVQPDIGGKMSDPFDTFLVKVGDKAADKSPFAITDAGTCERLRTALLDTPFTVESVKRRETQEKPNPPLITSTMQQQASTRLRFSASRTMRIAQQLYEGIELGAEGPTGLITYMRTDSLRIADEALNEVRGYIGKRFSGESLPEKPNSYKSNRKAQEAHEAVRPTSALRAPQDIEKYLTPDQHALYKLIWERFVASQMKPAIVDTATVDIGAGECRFRSVSARYLFEGYRQVHPRAAAGSKYAAKNLPEDIGEDSTLKALEVTSEEHETQPPARFTEASLIKTLEKEGIGRPSTYATIISTLADRGYVELKERRFTATELGILVSDKLEDHFADIMDVEFTSRLEDELDEIENSDKDWKKLLKGFYDVFEKDLEKAKVDMASEKGEPAENGEVCEKCGKPMVVRWSKRGRFLGCSGFPDCKNAKSLSDADNGEPTETDEKCDKCGEKMIVRAGRNGMFLACSAYPDCRNTRSITPEKAPSVEFKCKKCNEDMVVKTSKQGMFYACSGYPDCKNTVPMDRFGKPVKLEEIDAACEKCGEPLIVKWSNAKKQKFIACSGYPKCKNAKPYSKKVLASFGATPEKEEGETPEEK